MSTQNPNWWIGRKGATHVVASGMHDPAAIIERSLGPNLRRITDETIHNYATADQLEVLIIGAQDKYTCCLHARSLDKNRATRSTPVESPPGATAAITRATEQYLPEFFGIETGDLWLGPLCSSKALCDRAVETSANWSLQDTDDPLGKIIAWGKRHNRWPTVIQLLIQPAAHRSYDVTLRAMHPASHPPLRPREIGAALHDGINSPFDAMRTAEIGSARSLAATHWEVENVDYGHSGEPLWYPTAGDSIKTATQWDLQLLGSRQSLLGHIETRGFLTASPLTSRYEPFGVNPQLSVDDQELKHLLDLSSCGSNVSIDSIDGLSVPRFDRHNSIRSATGTDADAVLPSPATTKWRTLPHKDSPLEIIYSWFGIGSLTDSNTDPDYLRSRVKSAHLTDQSPLLDGHVVIVDRNATGDDVAVGTAAGVVSVANNAIQSDNWLWVAAVDEASGRWAAEVLRNPIKQLHETYVEPYLLSKAWMLDDGTVPFADRRHDLRWQITPDGHWRLVVNDVIRAHGSLDEVTNPAHLTLPRLVKTETGYQYVCPDADPHEYSSVDEIETNLQPISQPYPPCCPTFAGLSTVLYVDRATVRTLHSRPSWHGRTSKIRHARGYRTAAEEFLEDLTMPRPSDGPPLENLWPWLSRYYRSQADYDLQFPRIYELSEVLETRVRHTDKGIDYLPDRSWPIQPFAVPSDLHSNDSPTN